MLPARNEDMEEQDYDEMPRLEPQVAIRPQQSLPSYAPYVLPHPHQPNYRHHHPPQPPPTRMVVRTWQCVVSDSSKVEGARNLQAHRPPAPPVNNVKPPQQPQKPLEKKELPRTALERGLTAHQGPAPRQMVPVIDKDDDSDDSDIELITSISNDLKIIEREGNRSVQLPFDDSDFVRNWNDESDVASTSQLFEMVNEISKSGQRLIEERQKKREEETKREKEEEERLLEENKLRQEESMLRPDEDMFLDEEDMPMKEDDKLVEESKPMEDGDKLVEDEKAKKRAEANERYRLKKQEQKKKKDEKRARDKENNRLRRERLRKEKELKEQEQVEEQTLKEEETKKENEAVENTPKMPRKDQLIAQKKMWSQSEGFQKRRMEMKKAEQRRKEEEEAKRIQEEADEKDLNKRKAQTEELINEKREELRRVKEVDAEKIEEAMKSAQDVRRVERELDELIERADREEVERKRKEAERAQNNSRKRSEMSSDDAPVKRNRGLVFRDEPSTSNWLAFDLDMDEEIEMKSSAPNNAGKQKKMNEMKAFFASEGFIKTSYRLQDGWEEKMKQEGQLTKDLERMIIKDAGKDYSFYFREPTEAPSTSAPAPPTAVQMLHNRKDTPAPPTVHPRHQSVTTRRVTNAPQRPDVNFSTPARSGRSFRASTANQAPARASTVTIDQALLSRPTRSRVQQVEQDYQAALLESTRDLHRSRVTEQK